MTAVTIFAKPGCHLCEDARAVVREVIAGRDVDLREVDISLDPTLFRRYGERIPVVAVDDEELFDFFVDPVVLAERLERVRPRPGRGEPA